MRIGNWRKNVKDSIVAKKQSMKGLFESVKDDPSEIELMDCLRILLSGTQELKEKNIKKVIELLTKNHELVKIQFKDSTMLHLLCESQFCAHEVALLEFIAKLYPECLQERDENGRTPLHLLCLNPSSSTESLRVVAIESSAALSVSDNKLRIPLHYCCQRHDLTREYLVHVVDRAAGLPADLELSTPLHHLCSNKSITLDLLHVLCAVLFNETESFVDQNCQTPIHLLCQNPQATPEMFHMITSQISTDLCTQDQRLCTPLHYICESHHATSVAFVHAVLAHCPESLSQYDCTGKYPLHLLCANNDITFDILETIYKIEPNVASLIDKQNSTALHLLSCNPSLTFSMAQLLLAEHNQSVEMRDLRGATPIHHLCGNPSVTEQLLWAFIDGNGHVMAMLDQNGRTPLHFLCHNPTATPELIKVVLDIHPDSANVLDQDLKLPLQYLEDFSSSRTAEIAFLLTHHQPLVKQRYEIRMAEYIKSKESIIDQGYDLISCRDVLIQYFAHRERLNHDIDLLNIVGRPNLVATYHDVSRRYKKETDRTSSFYTSAMVLEAPVSCLMDHQEQLRSDIRQLKAMVMSLVRCLQHWHQHNLCHGNIQMSNVFQFQDGEYWLLNFNHATRFNSAITLPPSMMPPEFARQKLAASDPVFGAAAIDIWQAGCLVYEIIVGRALMGDLIPWIDEISDTSLFHLLLSLEDSVLSRLLEREIQDLELRNFLLGTLTIDPQTRCLVMDPSVVEFPVCRPNPPLDSEIHPLSEQVAHLQHEINRYRQLGIEIQTELTEKLETEQEKYEKLYLTVQSIQEEKNLCKNQLEELLNRLQLVLEEREESYKTSRQLQLSERLLQSQLEKAIELIASLLPPLDIVSIDQFLLEKHQPIDGKVLENMFIANATDDFVEAIERITTALNQTAIRIETMNKKVDASTQTSMSKSTKRRLRRKRAKAN